MGLRVGCGDVRVYNDDEQLVENSFVVLDAALADVSAALRRPAVNGRAPKAELAIAQKQLFVTKVKRHHKSD
jgi:hypothetical protein